MNIHVKKNTIPKILLGIVGILFILHASQLIAYYLIADSNKFDFIELLDFDYEGNLPSFYSALAILLAAFLLLIIAYKKFLNNESFKRHWAILCIIFIGLSLDEGLGLHEELGDFVESLQLFEATGFLYFAWIVPYGLLLTLFLFSYSKFIFSLPKTTMLKFVSAGGIFIFGALGLESISAKEADLNGSTTILYSALYTIEELCEMLGIVLFIHALLEYISKDIGEINFRIHNT